ncbi:DUF1611 domain-containing protein [Psychrosphaera sp. 1_MG-2023]|uniref:DUF1611 domain-containing protein n=1 Tax=Psychrosphaera sp. 1_MG-2023 TaxID=3062643 RepID=UPI0026E1824E|nr:DUF1611 domain-containing protein [Psychrosphaera sp. 1_MG-2023]MDO6720925.1 DUF1611 domain-containing protein [Psychrosphaera sp. 1_MG-2023]
MKQFSQLNLQTPYLLFIGDTDNLTAAKTASGIVQWRPELVAGQLRFKGNPLDLGVKDLTIEEAVNLGVKSLVIGVAPIGGNIDQHWLDVLRQAANAGLDIVSGLHIALEDIPQLQEIADLNQVALINVRTPPKRLPIANGLKRPGKRLLTVGTDCAVGKKYTALSLVQSMEKQSIKAKFCATGQTGIMLEGNGIPIDAVVADFVSGAAECVSPATSDDLWSVIEGQGSLYHPAYAAVSLGLLHGSQPDAIVVCHDATRTTIAGFDDYPVPNIAECISENLRAARLTNPNVVCIGVSINTSGLPKTNRVQYLQDVSAILELPCVDPLIDGCDAITQNLINHFD